MINGEKKVFEFDVENELDVEELLARSGLLTSFFFFFPKQPQQNQQMNIVSNHRT